MKAALIAAALALALTACTSTEGAATQGFHAFAAPCDRHSFAFAGGQDGETATFHATCKLRKPK